MDETILNDVCMFCYKSVDESVHLWNNDGSQTVPKFCKFLERVCGKRFNESSSSGQILATCEACVSIVDSFNELYHQVQCLQLQMEWKLDKLKNVMKCADKIPSRVKAFRERYYVPKFMLPNHSLNGKEYKRLFDTRNVIKLQVTEYLSNVIPHVRLDPIRNRHPKSKHSNLKEKKVHPPHLQEPRLQLNNNPYFALEWLKTVIGLTMCCLPTVRYPDTPDSFVTLENSPEIIIVSDVLSESEPEAAFSVTCASAEIPEEIHCSEQMCSSFPSSPDNFEDAIPDSPDPVNSPMDECRMEEEDAVRLHEDNEFAHSIAVSLDSKLTVRAQNMETDDNNLKNPYQPCSSSDEEIICISKTESLECYNESINQKSLVQNSTENMQNETCTNLQVDETSAENWVSTRTRQLRPKFKCKNCCLTFSTSNRLNEHFKSCSSINDFNGSEDEDNLEEDVEAAISDNGNYDVSSDVSGKELKGYFFIKEDSDSDYSDEELNEEKCNIKRNTPKKVKVTKTKSRSETDCLSLEECLEMYKKTNGQTLLSEQNVSTLKLTATDIQLKGFESLETCKVSECNSELFSNDELEYHKSLHGQFKCYFCEFSSNFAAKIASHELEHKSNLENGLCPRCPGVKIQAVNYKKHFVEHHLKTSVKYRWAQCFVCSMSFPETDQVPLLHFVNEHDVSRLNDPEKVFHCNEDNCSAYFLIAKQLITHLLVVHNKTKKFWYGRLFECSIECDICAQKFPFASALRVHKMRKHRKSSDAGRTVVTDDGLTIDDIVGNQNAKIRCLHPSCKRKFVTKRDRDAHSKHHGTFKCNFCSVEKTFAPDLSAHELEHADFANIRPSMFPRAEFKCSRCTYTTFYKRRYTDHHIEKHLKLSPDKFTITCPICQQMLSSCGKVSLRICLFEHFVTRHDKSQLNDPTSAVNCEHCHAYFLKQTQLDFHNSRVHPEKTFLQLSLSCDDCNQHFQERSELLSHRSKDHHKNDASGYQFICEVDNCSTRFEYKCDLERHHLWHFSERLNLKKDQERVRQKRKHQKLKCKQCVKTFPNNSKLRLHMLRHSGPKSWQFTCDVCFKKCFCKQELNQHMESHPNSRLAGSLNECLEIYKNTNGKIPLSQENIDTLKLTGGDIQLNNVESSLESCNLSGCAPGLYTTADLEYHRHFHGKFQCSFCDFNSNFATNLIKHELKHTYNLGNGFCPKCPGKKVEESDYKKHFVEHHLEAKVKYKCAQCPVCFQSFETDQVPLLHFVNEHDISRLNDPEKVFSCNEEKCSAYFLTTKQLIAHSKVAHNKTKKVVNSNVVDTILSCDICPRKFVRRRELDLHKKKAHRHPSDETGTEESDFMTAHEKFPCNSCKRRFFSEKNRTAHSKLHGEFKCENCPVKKSFAPDLALHEIRFHSKPIKSVSSKNTFNCSRCEFSSKGRDNCIRHHLEKHLDLSPDTFTINCQICQQPFADPFYTKVDMKTNLLGHFRTHHDKSGINDLAELFNCTHCPAYFLTQLQLHFHNQRVHPEQFPSLSLFCADCNKQFRTRRELLNHRIRVYHNDDESGFEFICQVDNCNKRFEYECDLENHITWHSCFTPKPCPECGKVLMNQRAYDQHVKSHQGHVCEQCGKKFKQKCDLVLHMIYHAGPDSWQFMCDICSRKCPTKDKLADHKKVHSKTKPYICDKCGATYAHRHNWRHHLIKIHGVPDFTRKHTKTANTTSRKGMKDQQNVSSRRKKNA